MTRPDSAYRSDCSRCAGLCCVALSFTRSADFPEDKAAGDPCRHLGPDFGCGIHDRLRDRGYNGCTVFECSGAGQQVTQVTFGGADWRTEPDLRQSMFDVFDVMRQLHEMLALLEEAAWRGTATDLSEATELVSAATAGAAEQVLATDIPALRTVVGNALRQVSTEVRRPAGPALSGADLVGRDLRRRDLRSADLRSALLISVDLRGVDLADADLLGADLRDAAVAGADLSRALFLGQAQVNAMRGDASTRLPDGLARPAHWK
ncbi:pentapeptide repeat-containing protein [Nocardioides sp. NBC_00163]|uniref:pentapeptide repeat-containing protein n=1 Tax=Nocardioides sp. NBC_00163 TaxID=2975999 RepID=UPI00324E089A